MDFVRLCFQCLLFVLEFWQSSAQDWEAPLSLWSPESGLPPDRLVSPWIRHPWDTRLNRNWVPPALVTRNEMLGKNATLSHRKNTGTETVHERRLTTAATILGPTLSPISALGASNIAIARLTSTKVVVAYSDYEYYFKGRLVTCEVTSGSLACGASTALTSVPIHTDEHSLAIDSIWMDEVIFAWKEGVSPFVGHVQACMSDMSSCGPDLEVRVGWGYVAVMALAQRIVVFAYNDVQIGHRGSIVRCDVNNMNLNCDLPKMFESKPITTLALGALTSDTLPYSTETSDMLIAYQVSTQTEEFGNIQACMLASDGASIECYLSSSVKFNHARTDGISITAFSPDAFALGYADRTRSCPRTNRQNRRRALQVCTVADGHPSIGRLRLCRATFRGLGMASPILECSESGIIDDGYATGIPYIVKRDGTPTVGQPWHFLTIYPCTGCDDLDAHGWAQSCIAGPMPSPGFAIASPGCSSRLLMNANATQYPRVAAIDGGFVVAYNDYGGHQYLTTRLIS